MNLLHVARIALASLAANALFIWWGRETFMPLALVWVSAVLLGILLLILAAILHAFNKARPDPAARLSIRMSVASAIVCFALLPSVPLLARQHRADLAAARARAEALLPALQQHLHTTGLYPDSLSAVAGAEPLPWVLRVPDAYRGTGTGYIFQIRYPGNPFTADVRRHTDTRWRISQ